MNLRKSLRTLPFTTMKRLLELEDHINFLLKGARPTPTSSLAHTPQAYANAVHSNSHPQNKNKPPKLNTFAFREHTGPSPQPQALGTSFEARVRDYMAAHTERMERFENTIFKQREEINGRMTEMFGLLKELTTSRTPKKVLIREETKFLVTKNSRSRIRVGKKKEKEYKILPGGPAYEAILKKKITKKEDIRGNFKIPCGIGDLKHVNALVD
ncbi:hypothetical protein Tco_0251224 [Tanacetum coccineum]